MKTKRFRFAVRRLSWSICVGLLLWTQHGPVLGGGRNTPISLPGAGWELAVKRTAFKLSDDQFDSAGTSRMMTFEHSDGRFNFTVTMKPVSVSLEEARAERLRSLRDKVAQLDGEREWELDEVVFLEYVTEDAKNGARTKHVYAFLAADETVVEVHFVKMSFKQYQQKQLDSLTDSLAIIPGKGKG